MIPKPASLELRGKGFRLGPEARIIVTHRSPRALAVGVRLARLLRRSTGYRLPVRRPILPPTSPAIVLARTRSRSLGREGYRLRVTREAVRLSARTGEGLFRGVQTLRQLLPAKVESRSVRRGPWRVPGVRVVDRPRFAWRGAHLDVARHFFSVAEVKRYVDLIAQYKVNVLHLHLSDDQGWRLAIKSWPRLATYGGSTEIGGGPGGLLHAARPAGDRALRRRPLHHARAGDRHAGPHQRGSGGLSASSTATAGRRRSTRGSGWASARSAWTSRSPTSSSRTWCESSPGSPRGATCTSEATRRTRLPATPTFASSRARARSSAAPASG